MTKCNNNRATELMSPLATIIIWYIKFSVTKKLIKCNNSIFMRESPTIILSIFSILSERTQPKHRFRNRCNQNLNRDGNVTLCVCV